MASLVSENKPNLKALLAHVQNELPHYARPVFLRLSNESETTSTFKFKKTNLVKAGFNPDNISETVYLADETAGNYVPIDGKLYQAILEGTVRL